jgi:carboxyl-terminal processing protease
MTSSNRARPAHVFCEMSAPRALGAALVVLLVAGAKPAAKAEGVDAPADPLVNEVLASLEASSVSRVPLERYALAGLDVLADHDKCLGRKGADAGIVLVCGERSVRAAWPPKSVPEVARLLSAAMRLVDERGEVTQQRARRVVRALARAVDDPFTAYLPPEIVSAMSSQKSAQFLATPGIEVWPRDPMRVREVRVGSDAARSGVQVDDRIVSLEGVQADKLSFPEIQALLSGAPDSVVRVSVAGAAGRRDLVVARTMVPDSDLVHRVLEGGVLYVHVPSFKRGTAAHVAKTLREAGTPGVILDLRHNGGGLVEEGVAIADLFLRDGVIGGLRSGPGRPSEDFRAKRDGAEISVPLVVLIDGGSASASELVAMVLKERGRAQLLGSTTAGKGSVQRVIHLPDGGVLKVTAGYYVGPSGARLDDDGVKPHRFLAPASTRTVVDGADPLADSWVLSALDSLQGERTDTSLYFGSGPAP